MYTISKFSQLCKMSTRMLRHYDKEQLLKPVHVDTMNGYRYYGKNQLETALQIKKLREYQFSLPEIRTILQSTDSEFINQSMHLKIQELSQTVNQYRDVITQMRRVIDQGTVMLHKVGRSYDVLFGMRTKSAVISQRLRMNIADMDLHLDKLYDRAEKEHITLIGTPSAVFWDEEFVSVDCDIELIIPLMQGYVQKATQEWNVLQFPETLVATTLHIGDYDYIGYAHIAIEEWMENNGYCLDGPPYETYLKGRECDCSPEEYVTQVCFPIMKQSN